MLRQIWVTRELTADPLQRIGQSVLSRISVSLPFLGGLHEGETPGRKNILMTYGTLHIETRTFAEITILDCSGRIVVGAEADHLFDVVTSAMDKSGSGLLNLAGVSAIDSGGLGMIVLLHRYAANS